MTQQQIDRLLEPVPPSGIDLSRIVSRERRRRRAVMVSQAFVAVVVVAGAVFAGATLVGVGSPAAVKPADSTPSAQAWLPTDPDAVAERLRAAMIDALAQVAPDATWVRTPEQSGPEVPWMSLQDATVAPGDDALPAVSVLTGLHRGGEQVGVTLRLVPDCGPGPNCLLTCDPVVCSVLEARAVIMHTSGDYVTLSSTVKVENPDYILKLTVRNSFGHDDPLPESLLSQSEVADLLTAIARHLIA